MDAESWATLIDHHGWKKRVRIPREGDRMPMLVVLPKEGRMRYFQKQPHGKTYREVLEPSEERCRCSAKSLSSWKPSN